MCGIIGAIANRDVVDILLNGLQRLEYRGYDSAGLAVLSPIKGLQCLRSVGKVQSLIATVQAQPVIGNAGIAHTRWATHGKPNKLNAHPHISNNILAVVHNGIIENHLKIRKKLMLLGYQFTSETDTEVIAHLVHHELKTSYSLLLAVQQALTQLKGAYSIVILDQRYPDRIIAARSHSPLVIGYGANEHFIASDQLALLPITNRFTLLEEGDIAEINYCKVAIFDRDGHLVQREIFESDEQYDAGNKGQYKHYMLKEIHEQPAALQKTLAERIANNKVVDDIFGQHAFRLLSKVKQVHIIACGTSYNAAMVARYWFESLAKIPCNVEIASEFRYREPVVLPGSLLVTLSQSGETADTLAALRLAKQLGYMASLAICNISNSSLVRESDMVYLMKAGTEIGVASTKAFTVQLAGLLLLITLIGRYNGLDDAAETAITSALQSLPDKAAQALSMDHDIQQLAEDFTNHKHALFLGRRELYPIALEGALKLKEISYIHAEAYAAGELKHGPLALVDSSMPIITLAPNNSLLEKLRSNIEEARARGGLLYLFVDKGVYFTTKNRLKLLEMPQHDPLIAPIIYTIPLQLLSYYIAIIKGTDIDQPRNLAKSVTVE